MPEPRTAPSPTDFAASLARNVCIAMEQTMIQENAKIEAQERAEAAETRVTTLETENVTLRQRVADLEAAASPPPADGAQGQ